VIEGDVLYGVLRGHAEDPGPSALALRLMGAVHRIVLRGDAPELARHYPSAGASRAIPGRRSLPPCAYTQTSCAGSSTIRFRPTRPLDVPGLLGGFLEIARRTRRPLRLLEVGASAGLNLRFDSYRYELGDERWGPADSDVVLRSRLSGRPPLDGSVRVGARAASGCGRH
jgi:hypothetical protein